MTLIEEYSCLRLLEQKRVPLYVVFVDEKEKERLETVVAWIGYSIALIALIALLLGLVWP
jgi:hypothetical protein